MKCKCLGFTKGCLSKNRSKLFCRTKEENIGKGLTHTEMERDKNISFGWDSHLLYFLFLLLFFLLKAFLKHISLHCKEFVWYWRLQDIFHLLNLKIKLLWTDLDRYWEYFLSWHFLRVIIHLHIRFFSCMTYIWCISDILFQLEGCSLYHFRYKANTSLIKYYVIQIQLSTSAIKESYQKCFLQTSA